MSDTPEMLPKTFFSYSDKIQKQLRQFHFNPKNKLTTW